MPDHGRGRGPDDVEQLGDVHGEGGGALPPPLAVATPVVGDDVEVVEVLEDTCEPLRLLDRAIYVERATMEDEIVLPLAQKTDDAAPYFAMVIVGGAGRRT